MAVEGIGSRTVSERRKRIPIPKRHTRGIGKVVFLGVLLGIQIQKHGYTLNIRRVFSIQLLN
jgi:hypothetical protein